MIMGYGIVAVPTGIVSVEISQAVSRRIPRACHNCGNEGHDSDAVYCKFCGARL
ncbi:MAG TPA: hypothetical protein VJM57_07950 [Thermodesulfobacteriota bacterium]|nr:hypothetical protein [Thermodesulfobacteriota bacterium]